MYSVPMIEMPDGRLIARHELRYPETRATEWVREKLAQKLFEQWQKEFEQDTDYKVIDRSQAHAVFEREDGWRRAIYIENRIET